MSVAEAAGIRLLAVATEAGVLVSRAPQDLKLGWVLER